MDIIGILQIAFAILDWVVDWVLIFCGFVFALIMVKTLLDVMKKNVDTAAPGLNRFFGWMR